VQNQQEWNLHDTIYTEPCWNDFVFCQAIHGDSGDREYENLKERHEAILLKRGCSLVAVRVDPGYSDKPREEIKSESREWHATFEDAVDAVASRVHARLVKEQDQLTGVMKSIAYHRKKNADV
jgi:hypothetical protein